VFLLIDTFLEAMEVSQVLPGVFQGIPLIIFAALLTWLVLITIGNRRNRRNGAATGTHPGLYIATLIAISIGLHNLGEGLAIGAAFSLGEAALGAFLVIGFTLHNITEGVGIVAPLITSGGNQDAAVSERPRLRTFLGLALLAGAPAILGTWLGGFAFSPLLATLFLGIGVGAIWQVIVEVGGLLQRYAEAEDAPVTSWVNLAGFLVGILVMYLTAFLVKF
jgi:zinc transporter ZupT